MKHVLVRWLEKMPSLRDMFSMTIAKADDQGRLQIPGIKAGQVITVENQGNGIIILQKLKPAEMQPGKVKFVKEDGFTVGITDRQVSKKPFVSC